MHKKKFAIVFLVLACCLIVIIFASTKMNATNKDSSDEMIERIENALGDDLKKQSMTELVATLEYGNEDGTKKIYYRILKTTYYEADPAGNRASHRSSQCSFPC